MILIVSWYSDGSGEPKVEFHENESVKSIVAAIRDTENKKCRVWNLDKYARLIYDSDWPKEEEK